MGGGQKLESQSRRLSVEPRGRRVRALGKIARDAAPRTINTRHILDGQKKGAERAVETVPWDPVLHPAPRSDLSHLLRLVATRMMSFGLAERARAQKPTGERTYLRGMRVTRYHS